MMAPELATKRMPDDLPPGKRPPDKSQRPEYPGKEWGWGRDQDGAKDADPRREHDVRLYMCGHCRAVLASAENRKGKPEGYPCPACRSSNPVWYFLEPLPDGTFMPVR